MGDRSKRARESRDRLEWARARLLNAATETVCAIGDSAALMEALAAQTEANEDWQVAQFVAAGQELDPDDEMRLERMDAKRAQEVRR